MRQSFSGYVFINKALIHETAVLYTEILFWNKKIRDSTFSVIGRQTYGLIRSPLNLTSKTFLWSIKQVNGFQ